MWLAGSPFPDKGSNWYPLQWVSPRGKVRLGVFAELLFMRRWDSKDRVMDIHISVKFNSFSWEGQQQLFKQRGEFV